MHFPARDGADVPQLKGRDLLRKKRLSNADGHQEDSAASSAEEKISDGRWEEKVSWNND